ncbi:hypothetical protein A2627_05410 [Candidatus Woesebacteria bacterium RIFCSPHIGHO2_01_FULL_39_28]|uniref:Putative pre-16S rRNA nuclease n=1 Tax=Candidatus Woesebacteria bacterium RIFCSPHIGHO2_01_FULL_39_28 TaxID=1802496 RepID=A0A1F7YFB9_9BACT|nr:MAG: hypothetical protein A2627_05410 [Candidatus Woesebacteria bacterium RIFCSPHIGHO2_01_FULL_39_28]OGM58215.1 MAG: hypothetical protein A3A50_04365 [Candidatus Woesebacteria bacterium RIFCSPLOWO2_01_FULL_38_20]
MRILGIDYGRKKIGLAVATSILAEAYEVIRYETIGEAMKKIEKVAKEENVEKIVVGISEGQIGMETKFFANELKKIVGNKVVFQDETLSTVDAQSLAIDADVKRKKRKNFEDAFAATVMLQSYIDRVKG